MGCATGVVKYLVFIFNLIFALAGLAILVVGVLFKVNLNSELVKSDEVSLMSVAAIVIIVIGAIIFTIAFFGCCGAIKESSCMLTTYAIFLLALFIIQLAIGIFMFIEIKDENGLRTLFDRDFERDVERYSRDPVIRDYFDALQRDTHCCGAHGPFDWKWSNGSVPPSCCVDQQVPCRPDVSYVYNQGCSDKLFEYILTNVKRIGIAAIVIAVTELIGAIFALCLSSSIRNQYRRGEYA